MPEQHHREMCRCVTCARWWSFGPGQPKFCPCGGACTAVDMKAHIAALPARAIRHNHPPIAAPKPRGSCEACDVEHVEIEKRKKAEAEAAKKAAQDLKP